VDGKELSPFSLLPTLSCVLKRIEKGRIPNTGKDCRERERRSYIRYAHVIVVVTEVVFHRGKS